MDLDNMTQRCYQRMTSREFKFALMYETSRLYLNWAIACCVLVFLGCELVPCIWWCIALATIFALHSLFRKIAYRNIR